MNIRRAEVCLIGAAAAWGGALSLTKHALGELPPFTVFSIQLAASVTALWLIVLIRRETIPRIAVAVRLGVTGLLEPGLAYAIGVPGLQLASASEAAIISAFEPVLIMACAWLLFKERIKLQTAIAGTVAFIGIIALTAPGFKDGFSARVLGDFLLVASVTVAAFYVVISSRLMHDQSPLVVTAIQQTAGLLLSLLLLAFVFGVGAEEFPKSIGVGAFLVAALSGVIQYALAFWLYLTGLKGTDVAKAGLFLLLTPVFGLAFSMSFLAERLMPIQVGGIFLVLSAMLIVTRRQLSSS